LSRISGRKEEAELAAVRDDHLQALSRVPIFREFTRPELEHVLNASSESKFSAGAEIVREGATGTGFHLILSGTATVSQGGHTLRTLGPGDSFGDIALIDGGRRTATVTADEPVVTLALVQWEFKPLLLENAHLSYKLLVELCRRLRDAEARVPI
jgi:CRP-like cAMP-binding protein